MTAGAAIPVIEEYEENRPTGVEEELQEFQDIDRPWNPESIRVSTKSFSLRNMLDAIEESSLDLAPDFQRLKVWKPVQKAQLIESILLQIPLPAFYFAEDVDGTLRVVDGVQRLTTVFDFVRGENFPLIGLEYVADVEGRVFSDLPAPWQRRIFNTQIIAHVIDPATPRPVMYDIFRRINTGGTPLNAQEIRHCMSRARSRDFLRELTEMEVFIRATGGALSRQRRMIDREVALRFCAFYIFGPDRYEPPMDEFLWRTTEQLDDPRSINDADLMDLREAFARGLHNSEMVFGRNAFRKWPTYDDVRKPFNRALFESWVVELSQIDSGRLQSKLKLIAREARKEMTADYVYISAITASTGDRQRVLTRFQVAKTILESAGVR